MRTINKQVVILGLLTSLSLSAQARLLKPSINGQWVLTSRICTNGKLAQDNFKLGRDSMNLTISEGQGQLTTSIDGQIFGTGFSVDTRDGELIAVVNHRDLEIDPYFFVDKNNISLVTTGFGPGGSCDIGESLISNFERTPKL